MSPLYKLTDQNGRTHSRTQWGPGIEHSALPGDGPLCSAYWIHVYDDPLVAVLLNPIHAGFREPLLWEFRATRATKRKVEWDKLGVKSGRTVRTLDLPVFSREQIVVFAIYAAREVYRAPGWVSWADAYLSGADRSIGAARAARGTARTGAPWAARVWAAESARAAAGRAVEAAERSAYAASGARSYAASEAAEAAAGAVEAAAEAAREFEVRKIARRAYEWRDPKVGEG